MKFKGDIIITDPCYIMRAEHHGTKNIPERPDMYKIVTALYTDNSELKKQQYAEYQRLMQEWDDKYDDWSRCNYGQNMEVLGIHTYLTRDTEYGDWSCTTFRDVPEAMKALEELNANFAELWNNINTPRKDESFLKKLREDRDEIYKKYDIILGQFCADAGLVSVFLLDEVLKYNPDFDYHINNKWTTTWIKDFDGDAEITHREIKIPKTDEEYNEIPGEFNIEEEVSVIGKGNINFFTSQTGL